MAMVPISMKTANVKATGKKANNRATEFWRIKGVYMKEIEEIIDLTITVFMLTSLDVFTKAIGIMERNMVLVSIYVSQKSNT